MPTTHITDAEQIRKVAEAAGWDLTVLPARITVTSPKAGGGLGVCACGCNEPTARTWAPGHDAKHKSRLQQLVRDGGEAGKAAAAELETRGWPLPVPKAAPAKQAK